MRLFAAFESSPCPENIEIDEGRILEQAYLGPRKRYLLARQLFAVCGSGRSRKDAIASPRVSKGIEDSFQIVKLMQRAFAKLQSTTITMIPN